MTMATASPSDGIGERSGTSAAGSAAGSRQRRRATQSHLARRAPSSSRAASGEPSTASARACESCTTSLPMVAESVMSARTFDNSAEVFRNAELHADRRPRHAGRRPRSAHQHGVVDAAERPQAAQPRHAARPADTRAAQQWRGVGPVGARRVRAREVGHGAPARSSRSGVGLREGISRSRCARRRQPVQPHRRRRSPCSTASAPRGHSDGHGPTASSCSNRCVAERGRRCRPRSSRSRCEQLGAALANIHGLPTDFGRGPFQRYRAGAGAQQRRPGDDRSTRRCRRRSRSARSTRRGPPSSKGNRVPARRCARQQRAVPRRRWCT